MITTFTMEIPRRLIENVFESDRKQAGSPTLQEEEREQAISWLRRALIDFDALDDHIALLQHLYDAPYRYSRPRRDYWSDDQLSPDTEPAKFPHKNRLSEDQISAIADRGLEIIDSPTLAKLILNPVALYDLFDVIDELHPEYWMKLIHDYSEMKFAQSHAVRDSSIEAARIEVGQFDVTRLQEIVAATVKGSLAQVMPEQLASTAAAKNENSALNSAPWRRKVVPVATLLAMAASFAALMLSFAANQHVAQQLDIQRDADARVAAAQTHEPFDLTSGPSRLAKWDDIWDAAYAPGMEPTEILGRIYHAAPIDLRQLIDQMKKANRSDAEIIAFLRYRFSSDHK